MENKNDERKNNKKRGLKTLIGISIFFILFCSIPIIFNVFSFEALPMTFIGAAMGAVITILITSFLLDRQSETQEKLLEKQSETEEKKEYHLRIFEKKAKYFQEFIDLVWDIWREEKISCDQYEELTSAYYKNLMIYIANENRLKNIGTAISDLGNCLEKESNECAHLIHKSVLDIINILSEDLETGGKIIQGQIEDHKNKLFPVLFRKKLLESFNEHLVSPNSDILESGKWLKWMEGDNIIHDDMVFEFKNYKDCSIRLGFACNNKGEYNKNFIIILYIPFGKHYHGFNKYRKGLDSSLLNKRIKLNGDNNLFGKYPADEVDIPYFNFSEEKIKEIKNNYNYKQISVNLAQRAGILFEKLTIEGENLTIVEFIEKYYEK